MKKRLFRVVMAVLVVVGIGAGSWFFFFRNTGVAWPVEGEVDQGVEHPLELSIPLDQTVELRASFTKEVNQYLSTKKNFNLRPIYERYIDQIGANGIIAEIQRVDPLCHYQGHDLGKVIFARVGTIGESLRVCQEACYSGCMHGVFMEAFKAQQEQYERNHPEKVDDDHDEGGGHIDIEVIKDGISSICTDPDVQSTYSQGDCAHGVGHAITYLADYDWKVAAETCKLFSDEKMAYYCATGVYMEYVSAKGSEDLNDPTKSLFYPCDQSPFPAACFFSKVADSVAYNFRKGGKVSQIVEACLKMPDLYQWGCFHGYGNAFIGQLHNGSVSLKDLCAYGSEIDKRMCIEGAMMRTGKYAPQKGEEICKTQLSGDAREYCLKAVGQKMYGFDRPFEYYVESEK